MSTVNVTNPLMVKEKWNDSVKKLQTKFPTLTNADLEFADGKEEDLLKRIQGRLNKKREEVVGIIKEIQQ